MTFQIIVKQESCVPGMGVIIRSWNLHLSMLAWR